MKCVELNQAGNFSPWENERLQELKTKEITTSLGKKLLFENDNIRVWEVVLYPKERLPFRKIEHNYSLVSMTDGLAVSRCADGKISLLRIKKGHPTFVENEGRTCIRDFENIGENILFLHAMEFKPLVESIPSSNITSFI